MVRAVSGHEKWCSPHDLHVRIIIAFVVRISTIGADNILAYRILHAGPSFRPDFQSSFQPVRREVWLRKQDRRTVGCRATRATALPEITMIGVQRWTRSGFSLPRHKVSSINVHACLLGHTHLLFLMF